MFKDNKYTKYYYSIINRAAKRKDLEGYSEVHHILPRCLGGTDDESNKVNLTAKEHYVCHHLLTRMVTIKLDSIWYAFFVMHLNPSKNSDRPYNARLYSLAKNKMSDYKRRSSKGKDNHFYGKTHSKKTRKKMSDSWNRNKLRNVDNKVYEFFHEDHGSIKCTRVDLCKKFNLKQKDIYKIVNGIQKTTHGWRLNG